MSDLVSVVIPTYHRPERLARAVSSVLGQELPPGWQLETIIAVSDKESSADLAAAQALSDDVRVRVVVADRPGPGVARNAALRVARGNVLAFTDDDCVAQAGWLKLSLAAMASADIVQGSTVPAGPIPPLGHSLLVSPPSWQWETCNLVVSREAIDRAGLFDEDWNPTGRVGDHYGEDLEWGWRLIRTGARPAFVPDARVEHDVIEQGLLEVLRYDVKLRHYPKMLRSVPETRRHFFLNYFVTARHAVLTLIMAIMAVGATAAARGNRRTARWSLGVALVLWLYPVRGYFEWFARLSFRTLRSDLANLRASPPLSRPPETAVVGIFSSRRQAVLAVTAALAVGSALSAITSHRRAALFLAGSSTVGLLEPMRKQPILAEMCTNLGIRALRETAEFFPLVAESLRRRQLLL